MQDINTIALKRHFYIWTRRMGIFLGNVAAWQIIRSMWGYDAGMDALYEATRSWGVLMLVGFWSWYLLRNVESEYPRQTPSP